MKAHDRNPNALWRKGATEAELREIEYLDTWMEFLDTKRGHLTSDRNRICRRAIKRYHARRAKAE